MKIFKTALQYLCKKCTALNFYTIKNNKYKLMDIKLPLAIFILIWSKNITLIY